MSGKGPHAVLIRPPAECPTAPRGPRRRISFPEKTKSGDMGCVLCLPDIPQDHPLQTQPNSSSARHTCSKIRDLMVFVEEGTALPLLAASGLALAQQHCNDATSSVCCPHISWAALGICLLCSLLITCLEAAASTSKRSKNYNVCSQNEYVGHGAPLPWTYPCLPWSCPQLVLKRHILHCCGGSAVQTLQMLVFFVGYHV